MDQKLWRVRSDHASLHSTNRFLAEVPALSMSLKINRSFIWATAKAKVSSFFFVHPSELRSFFLSRDLAPLFARYREQIILSRVHTIATLFALLTPLWIGIDFLTFSATIATRLAVARVLVSIAFAILACLTCRAPTIGRARLGISVLVAIPAAFFVFSRAFLNNLHFNIYGSAAAEEYRFLPFVLISGLAIFPLVFMESALLALPVLLAFFVSDAIDREHLVPGLSDLAVFWLLLIITVVGSISSLSQLQLMKRLFQQSSLDPLTHVLNRRSGEEILAMQAAQAQRHHFPLAVIFVDLDDFKSLNDKFGHNAGDTILTRAADNFHHVVRAGDAIVRWGGEEFLLVMPYTDAEAADDRMRALLNSRPLTRPDGTAQTWSGGIAEWWTDGANAWSDLVTIADDRMYQAKKAGKARIIAPPPGIKTQKWVSAGAHVPLKNTCAVPDCANVAP